MELYTCIAGNSEYLRGNEIQPGTAESPPAAEGPAATPPLAAFEAQAAKGETPDSEREKQLELWMDEVKRFIRRIDINNL